MKKNIEIAYALSFLWRAWFWLGIWVFYYLRFTDYRGIGILESIMITTATIGEIPTGVIADMVGKKKAVLLAFALGSIGNALMAVTPNFALLVVAIMTMTIGGAFYSGSLEALVYDSLMEMKKEKTYDKVIARISTMQNLGMMVAGITGGFLYKIHESLPFFAVALCYLMGFVLALKLHEPHIDSQKYSISNFLKQNKIGFIQLFKNYSVSMMTIMLLIPSAFMIATENVINDASAIQLGFDSVYLGIFATVLYGVGVVASEYSSWIVKSVGNKMIFVLTVGVYILTLLFMPKVMMLAGAILLLTRYAFATIYSNWESVQINAVIDPQYRATTLSTFSLIKNIPYVLFAGFIGMMINDFGAAMTSMCFGLVLMLCLAAYTAAKYLRFFKR